MIASFLDMDPWNPTQYDKFRREREQPFFDLMTLIKPVPNPRVLDLGCGTGALTAQLHAHLHAAPVQALGPPRLAHEVPGADDQPGDEVREEQDEEQEMVQVALGSDAAAVEWVEICSKLDLAFDHAEIVSDARRILRSKGA